MDTPLFGTHPQSFNKGDCLSHIYNNNIFVCEQIWSYKTLSKFKRTGSFPHKAGHAVIHYQSPFTRLLQSCEPINRAPINFHPPFPARSNHYLPLYYFSVNFRT